jgi:mRNA-degrading endonuclease RelE of RelBE toxin-antitoxin system
MQYWLEISSEVRQQIERLPGHLRQRVKRIIAALRKNPRPAFAQELRGRPGRFRIRLDGDYRVFYRIEEERSVILILRVGKKKGSEFYNG